MRKLLVLLLCLVCTPALAATWDVQSDTWVATDGLGRSLPGYAQCGPPRARQVGIFYFLWLGEHGRGGPYDITRILAADPEHPEYGPVNAFHHWGQPELGYYLSSDPWVVRRHCQLLVDAGVDVVIFDVTNGYPYTDNYLLVCRTFKEIRQGGGATPQVCFLLNPDNNGLVPVLYRDLYGKGLYPDLWFQWAGKPLILTRPDGLEPALQRFFTFRRTWAWNAGRDNWTWLDTWPQRVGWHKRGRPEEISVTVAGHPTTNIGRSNHDGRQPPIDRYRLCPTTAQGLQFEQQWDRARAVDPPFVFVTGWNEWTAMRFLSGGGDASFLGKPWPKGESVFVDEFNQEFSRDIEPMRGGHGDAYYYQLVANVRRYKGVRPPSLPSGEQTISIDGRFEEWGKVGPEYRDTIGDTLHRASPGWGSAGPYRDTAGRNDLVRLKVARDRANVYLYAQAQEAITAPAADWMLLWIDADQDPRTGEHGYDYLVNHPAPGAVCRSRPGGRWEQVGTAEWRVAGNELELAIPRRLLGLGKGPVRLDFHWSDNVAPAAFTKSFAGTADHAPNRRFNYRYGSQ